MVMCSIDISSPTDAAIFCSIFNAGAYCASAAPIFEPNKSEKVHLINLYIPIFFRAASTARRRNSGHLETCHVETVSLVLTDKSEKVLLLEEGPRRFELVECAQIQYYPLLEMAPRITIYELL